MSSEKYLKLQQISHSHTPSELVHSLEFHETIRMAIDMLNNEEWEETLQEYGTNLLEELRKSYPKRME